MGVLFASADREPATYNSDFNVPRGYRGLLAHVAYTAEGGGTATLDFKLQYFDTVASTWEDLAGAATAQFTGVGELDLQVYPGIAAIANRAVSSAVPKRLRAVAVVGTDNLTFSASVAFLE